MTLKRTDPATALPKGYLYSLNPAQLIAWVGTVTLANISLYTTEFLQYIGWYNNPVVDKLYSLTYPGGVWIANRDASGQMLVSEEYGVSINSFLEKEYYLFGNDRNLARAKDVIGIVDLRTALYDSELYLFSGTLDGSGEVGPVALIGALGAGIQMWVEEFYFAVNASSVTNSARVKLQDDAGTPVVVFNGACRGMGDGIHVSNLGITTANQDLDLVVEEDSGGSFANKTYYGYLLIRQVS